MHIHSLVLPTLANCVCVFTICSQAKLCTLQGQLRCLYTLYILSPCGGPTHNLKVLTTQLQAHTYSCICTTSRQHQCTKKGKHLFCVCTHRDLLQIYVQKQNPLPAEPGNARHSFLIPMHTRVSPALARPTHSAPPTTPSLTQQPLPPKTTVFQSENCSEQLLRPGSQTNNLLFRAQKPLFWPHQALQGMTSHAVRTAPARLHALWRNKILPLPTRICTLMPPAATAFAVIASRFQHCAAEHYLQWQTLNNHIY